MSCNSIRPERQNKKRPVYYNSMLQGVEIANLANCMMYEGQIKTNTHDSWLWPKEFAIAIVHV
jgi:hypothetical protein